MIFIWIKVETNHCKRCQLVFEEHKGYKGITHQPHSGSHTGEQKHCFIVKKEHQHTGEIAPERTHERTAYKSVDYFNCTVIGNKIQEFYTFRRQLPTIRSLHKVLCDDIDFLGSTTSLRKIIKRLGFFWKKTRDNRKVLMERPNVVPLRLVFYDHKKHLEDSGHQLVSTRPGSIPPIRPNPVSKVQWFSIK